MLHSIPGAFNIASRFFIDNRNEHQHDTEGKQQRRSATGALRKFRLGVPGQKSSAHASPGTLNLNLSILQLRYGLMHPSQASFLRSIFFCVRFLHLSPS